LKTPRGGKGAGIGQSEWASPYHGLARLEERPAKEGKEKILQHGAALVLSLSYGTLKREGLWTATGKNFTARRGQKKTPVPERHQSAVLNRNGKVGGRGLYSQTRSKGEKQGRASEEQD